MLVFRLPEDIYHRTLDDVASNVRDEAPPRWGRSQRTVGVYASSSDDVGGDDGKLLLRSTASVAMFHNGLDKLNDTEGFAQFVVGEHLTFLPDVLDATQWTYVAAGVELVCPALLLAGFFARPAAFALFSADGNSGSVSHR